MGTGREIISLWLGLLALAWFQLQAHGEIPRDQPVALIDKQTSYYNENYCATAENLEMKDGKKLKSYVGSCCQYPKVVWRHDGKIFSQDQSVCIGKSSDGTDVKFTNDVANSCAVFSLGTDGSLKITQESASQPLYIDRTTDGSYAFKLDGKISYSKSNFAAQRCEEVNVLQQNVKASLQILQNNYCWYAEKYEDGEVLMASKDKFCCEEVTFMYKSDKSTAVQSTATGKEFCLKIDGMPYGEPNDLKGKKIKLSSEGCMGTGFVHDTHWGLQRVYGARGKCLGKSNSNEIIVKGCATILGFSYKTEQCFNLSYSSSSRTQLDSTPTLLSSSSSAAAAALPQSTVLVSSAQLPSPLPPSSTPWSPFILWQKTPSLELLPSSIHASTAYPSPHTPTASATSTALASTLTVLPFVFMYNGIPVNGGWASWTEWSGCSVDCGRGTQERIRYCDNPSPKNAGKDCTGSSTETKECSMPFCSGRSLAPTHRSCGEHCADLGLVCLDAIDTGNSRECFKANCSLDESDKLWTMDYQPAYNSSNEKCTGYISVPAFVACNMTAPEDMRRLCNCIKNGDKGYSPWTPWSGCSLPCNGGTKSRTRICVSNEPATDECLGQTQQTTDCNTQKCPIDGGFSEWSLWTTCTKTCDGGVRERNRTCSNPFPEYGGSLCYGKYIEKESCAVRFCPVNGGWSDWTEWFHCNKPCNSGQRKRERWCNNPLPKYGGVMCNGNGTEAVLCNSFACPNATIDLENIAFDLHWNSSFLNPTGNEFLEFTKNINLNIKRLYEGELDTYHSVLLHSLRKGSVVASFTLYFTALDSFQTLYLMDSINVDRYLGKLPLVQSNQTVSNITSSSVPSSAPSNVTAVANDATSINVTWDEVPVPDQNGVITGYIVFYKEMTASEYTATATIHRGIKIQGLKAATQYAVRVLAYTSKGNGIASQRIVLSTAEKAPGLPPSTLSVLIKSAFSMFIQWTPPPASSWNGIIQGYKVIIKFESGAHTRVLNLDEDDVFVNIDQLIPDSFYIVDVCAFTSAGVGPCSRSYNRTFVSAPSVAPGNATCLNKTSPNAITVIYDPVPMDFIHGILKGYRIEYRAIKVGYKWESKYPVQYMMVNPFYIRATITNLLPNTAYEIQVMAVNEHGIGVKSQAFYGVTCTCPDVIYTNYAQSKPYIYRDTEGNMQGLFKILLQNITSNVCGLCNGKISRIDYVNDGKNGWAEKRSIAQVAKETDEYSTMNFPISGRAHMTDFIGKPYLSLISHPGMVLFTAKPTLSEQVADLLASIARLWPIFVINSVFILVAGIIYFFLTIHESPKSSKHLFIHGALRGSYWAYVTMFTHGYGDITPSTIISRIFAVMWIFVGLVLSAILIGGLTTALTTASILPEAKLYGTELATIQGSKEYIVGIYRNAKTNSKQNYSTIDDVYKALKNRKVQAALVDAFVAAGRSDLFSDEEIIARKMLQYSYSYGLVLSGEMKNAHTNIANYISNNRHEISKLIESSTPKFTINYAAKGVTSLFDPSSSILKANLIILSGLFTAMYILGTIFHFIRIKFRRKSHVYPDTWLENISNISREFFDKVESLHKSLDKTWDNRIIQYMNKNTEQIK